MATLTFVGQNRNTPTGDVTIGDGTHKLSFYGSAFNDPIQKDSDYNDSSHVENTSNVDQCSDPHLNNTKYTGASTISINGAGSEALTNLLTTECPLRIEFSHTSSVETSDATFFAYDGTTETNGPTSINFYAAEQGDSSWSQPEGSASAMSIADHGTPATDHDFHIAISVQPTAVGALTAFAIKFQLTYS